MAFIEMEDLSGSIEVVVFPKLYKKCKELLTEDKLLVIQGKVDVRDGKAQVISDYMQDYELASTSKNREPVRKRLIEVNLHCSGNRDRDVLLLRKAYEILEKHPGSDCFCFNIISAQGRVQLDFPNVTTNFEPELENLLKETLGEDALQVRWIEA